ncbi:hypothetical protein H0I23_00830 [Cellulophaga sp. HaHaR_3_176]|uniref:hypothetical protein n=1 Tax=Cellulophaga sp. HaHaR_3_176 TaxID=1942464 RepID=UPI001C1F8A7C|nr:hypothetical protein [Cellulophaga sp. HaHaR_3_176]QWX84227.1 hypothetical protein H0I23_00830 [Cellulophaga sp. HaHaR_3_176]
MKLYEQGYANIYVLNLIDEKANMSKVINANNQSNSYVLGDCFFLDFRFLNDQNIDIIKLGECKSC